MGIRKKDAQAGAGIWTVSTAVWGAYSSFTTARDLAGDAGEFRKMLADPPFELPWILAALGAIALVLIWRFWASDDVQGEDGAAEMSAKTAGGHSPVFQQTHSGAGHNVGIGNVENLHLGSPKIEITDELLDQIIEHLDKSRPVAIVWRSKKRGDELAERLEAGLRERGFQIGSKMGFGEITGVQFDQPITISPNGFRFGGMAIVDGQQAVAIETDL